MAFPATPSNNQVHKESGQNRAWVYDSAIGTWDQVRETDSTETKIVQGHELVSMLKHSVLRDSLTNPTTITKAVTAGDTLNAQGSFGGSGDPFHASSQCTLFGSNITAGGLTFDYGAGKTKKWNHVTWYQEDGGGATTGMFIRGSNNGTDWDYCGEAGRTIGYNGIKNGGYPAITITTNKKYRYWQIYYTWSGSGNYCNMRLLKIWESDIAGLDAHEGAHETTFPAGQVTQMKASRIGLQAISGGWTSNNNATDFTGVTQSDITINRTPGTYLLYGGNGGGCYTNSSGRTLHIVCRATKSTSAGYGYTAVAHNYVDLVHPSNTDYGNVRVYGGQSSILLPFSYKALDTRSLSGNYTYRTFYRGVGGAVDFQHNDRGEIVMTAMEFYPSPPTNLGGNQI